MTTLLVPWLAFPLLLGVLSLGCGLLLERAAGFRLPGTLLLPAGLAVLVVLALWATMYGATSGLATPAVIVAAVAGFVLSGRRPRRMNGFAIGAALAAFAAYAAPVVLSGRATFPGYLKLDDDSTFLANLDRAMHHGRSLAGLPPSTYLATLEPHLAHGYPLGAVMPIGIGRELVGGDAIWLYQPCVAFMAAMLALALYELTGRVMTQAWLRGLAAFIGAQSALLYGYALWGGLKEVAGAATIALAAALVVPTVHAAGRVRRFLPLAAASAALLGMLSVGAAIWLVPALLAALVAVLATRTSRAAVVGAISFALFLVVLGVPTLVASPSFLSNRVFEFDYLFNLGRPLRSAQIVGIWPVGDFRLDPSRTAVTYVLIGVVAAAAAVGVVWALHRGAWELPMYVVGAVGTCFVFFTFSTPWVDGKALATASAAVPVAAFVCCVPLLRSGRRVEGAVLAAAIAGGVLWSNVLQYHDAWLAPRAQLVELAAIGNRFAGQGPALMTEFQPYGVRHFLRKLDAEGASELRIRPIPLRTGQLVPNGGFANIDDFDPGTLLVYRTLVLRRSPVESRPPSAYHRVWQGRFYEVWQRPAQGGRQILDHLPLGSADQPAAVPACADVLRLAVRGGELAAVERPPAIVANLTQGTRPGSWGVNPGKGTVVPSSAGTLAVSVQVPIAGRYGLWLAGSFRDELGVSVDGRHVATLRNQLNNFGQYTPLGPVELTPGPHTVTLRYGGPDLQPGSAGPQFAMGPLVLSRTGSAPLMSVPSSQARSLCGKRLDWVEALGS